MTAALAPQPLRNGPRPALVMVVAVSMLALPSAVLAFSTRFDVPQADFAANQDFAPGQVDPQLARARRAEDAGQGAAVPLYPGGAGRPA